MNWSRAKNILIIFLLCTSVFMLMVIFRSEYKRTKVPEAVINSAVSLLLTNDIQINPSLISNQTSAQKIYSVENMITDYHEFATLVLDGELIPTDTGYSGKDSLINYNGDYFEIIFTNGVETSSNLKSPSEKAKSLLQSFGIDVSDSKVEVNNDAKGIFTVSYIQSIDKLPFFDCKLSVELDKSKIISIRGSWFKNYTPETSAVLESIPGLLVRAATTNSDLHGKEITSLEIGYAVDESDTGIYHKQTTIIPMLAIKTSDNSTYYIDARDK